MASSSIEEGKPAPIIIEPYNNSWPFKFEYEKKILETLLEPWITGPIEHIGSTAVPGLAAKPVIDIMVAVENLNVSRPAILVATAAGYIYRPYKANIMHWLCKPSDAYRTHHLHLVPYDSSLWQARIAFRDALRADSRLAEEYAQLKYRLADKYREDREAYTDAKSEIVHRVLKSIGLA